MKYLLFLCLTLLCSLAWCECRAKTCVAEGEACNSEAACTELGNCHLCYGGYGSCVDGVCYQFNPSGAPCTRTCDRGIDGVSYYCNEGTCVPDVMNAVPGDACSQSSACSTGMCEGTCIGLMDGENCTFDSQCGVSSFCDSFHCKPRSTEVGADCTFDAECASLAASCYTTEAGSEICLEAASVPIGNDCSDSLLCEGESFCNLKSRACEDPESTSSEQQCSESCPNGNEECLCNTDGFSRCYAKQSGCGNQYREYANCLQSSGCSQSSDVSNQNSCAYANCLALYTDFENCLRRGLRNTGAYDSSCVPDMAPAPVPPEQPQPCDASVSFSNYLGGKIYIGIRAVNQEKVSYSALIAFKSNTPKYCSYSGHIAFDVYDDKNVKLGTFERDLSVGYFYSYIIVYDNTQPSKKQTASRFGVADSLALPTTSQVPAGSFGYAFGHASASGPAIDINLGDLPIGQAVGYPTVTPVTVVTSGAGNYPVTVTEVSGPPLSNVTSTFATGSIYRGVVYDTADSTFNSDLENLGSPDEEPTDPLPVTPTASGDSNTSEAAFLASFVF